MRIIPTTLRKANDFVTEHHRHNGRTARDGGKFAIALEHEGVVVGIAIVGNPLSATLMDGFTAEVLRTCLSPDCPRNGNSMLYGACRRIWFTMGGRLLITYTLTDESGASLRGAGWRNAATSKGAKIDTAWGRGPEHQPGLPFDVKVLGPGGRKIQSIYGRVKYRWETENEAFKSEGV